MTAHVAYLSADCMQKSSPQRREDYWEHDLQFGAFQPACADRGIRLETVIWNRNDWDPATFDAVVVGTPWDYMVQADRFLACIDRLAALTRVFNPLETLRWNLDKGYLQDLARWGAPSVPTVWLASPDPREIEAAFATLDAEELVVKPRVGAGAWRQARIRRGEPLPSSDALPPGACMVQPFLPSVAQEGEYSFVYFGGRLSHTLVKVPQAGDYRVQSLYGASERVHEPSADERESAQAVLQTLPETPLYARVDMVRDLHGKLVVMELELIEPYLYPEQGPAMGPAFAEALRERLQA